ncbi:MAG: hypothetical protein EPN82_12965 [Bacteroidetes bacterium]|nr:MAG: hypothetical protein EPN82_12965 [Bacteroidota bacterium]
MNIKKLLLLFFLLMIFGIDISIAKSYFPGQWSFMLSGNFVMNYGISTSMQGTLDEFYKEFETNYENSKYPFAEGDVYSSNFGGQLAYRFPESPLSLYFNLTGTYFHTPKYSFFKGTERVVLLVGSFTPGIEYCFGEYEDLWNVFGRFGLCFSNIGGSVYYLSRKIDINYSLRVGFEIEAGGRFNIPGIPVSVELMSNYTNANLLLKDYTNPDRVPPQLLNERNLNDGEGENFKSKTIDIISLKLGFRLWL